MRTSVYVQWSSTGLIKIPRVNLRSYRLDTMDFDNL